ncbi:hypothetical protein RUESEDTHA_03731 [Ruegeria sp. THAF57]|uniref:MSMEG_0567/Sll0786 family nitrogen starvation N-acetyltransferase n=1 Tax=Ruegeria sp. THAF57 TaxID=2744555 RepID=UPI0015DFDEDE|nr:MSMEG_0567/Sll0786 family nitrogen starvation N-acetyltransferase [Ruegeria sp. THAF57]CAD0186820.1 hypothetical protein RUESEDTHA_03731 [Ruegeria sp. THAF57]
MKKKRIPVWAAERGDDLAAHYAIRHRVFVLEQGVLTLTDVDEHDDNPDVVHALAARKDECAGAVRLYPVNTSGRWKGDRLAVLQRHRTIVGAHLVRFATATAAARGGFEMEASVQLANVNFFQRLGWTCDGEQTISFGIPHQPMLFDLTTAPPLDWPGRPDGLSVEWLSRDQQTPLCPTG